MPPLRRHLPGHGVTLVLAGSGWSWFVSFENGEARGWEFLTREAAEAHLARCVRADALLFADRSALARETKPKRPLRAA